MFVVYLPRDPRYLVSFSSKQKDRYNYFLKQEYLLKIITCHAQTLRFYGQRHQMSEGSGNEISSISCNRPRSRYQYSNNQYSGSRVGAVARALASHQCGLGLLPGPGVIRELRLLLVLFSAPRGFSPGTAVFPSP